MAPTQRLVLVLKVRINIRYMDYQIKRNGRQFRCEYNFYWIDRCLIRLKNLNYREK